MSGTMLATTILALRLLLWTSAAAQSTQPASDAATASPASGVGLEWIQLAPGLFQMGCVPGDTSCDANETPRHEVRISRGFAVTATPITVEQYRAYAEGTGRRMPRQPEWSAAKHPVVETTWAEAAAFCQWAGGRLPTEAEWEYAARGGHDGALYPWGNEFAKTRVNTSGYGEDGTQTVPVGTFEPNGFGLHDLVGNVWQWVADSYDAEYYARSPRVDPPGPPEGRFRVARGASWKPYPKLMRLSNRGRFSPTHHNYYLGVRCARD
jgi:formylglycine-generating enzyme required for sulfatase activity